MHTDTIISLWLARKDTRTRVFGTMLWCVSDKILHWCLLCVYTEKWMWVLGMSRQCHVKPNFRHDKMFRMSKLLACHSSLGWVKHSEIEIVFAVNSEWKWIIYICSNQLLRRSKPLELVYHSSGDSIMPGGVKNSVETCNNLLYQFTTQKMVENRRGCAPISACAYP